MTDRGREKKQFKQETFWFFQNKRMAKVVKPKKVCNMNFYNFLSSINIFSNFYVIFLFNDKGMWIKDGQKVILNTASMVRNASMHAIKFLIVMWDYNCDSCVSNSELEFFLFFIYICSLICLVLYIL